MKTVITPVGVSLLENMFSEPGDVLGFRGAPSVTRVQAFENRCKSPLLTPQDAADLTDQQAKQMTGEFETAFAQLWADKVTARRKRRHSPAELASLSLLDLRGGDGVVLLYSETAKGAFCAAVLERLLRGGVAVPAGLTVEKRMTEGLQTEDLGRFTEEGVVNFVKAVEQVVDDAKERGSSALLNITGGYKGVAPIATIVALFLGVEVCYLYEESDELLFLPPLDLSFQFSSLFNSYKLLMQELTPLTRPLKVANKGLLENAASKDRNKLAKYLKTTGGDVQLSPLGVLAWILHTCRGEVDEATASGPLTHI